MDVITIGSWILFSLSNGVYFELLAVDPTSNIPHQGVLKELISQNSNNEGIITYMYRPPKKYNKNLKKYTLQIQNKSNNAYNPGSIFGGERILENGKILKWDLMCPKKDKMDKTEYQTHVEAKKLNLYWF